MAELKIIQKRKWYLAISSLLIVASFVMIALYGLNFGIDFTGGSLLEIQIESSQQISQDMIKSYFKSDELNVREYKLQQVDANRFIIRTESLTEEEHQKLLDILSSKVASDVEGAEVQQIRFESVGPVIGQELKRKAGIALLIASVVIILYIAWSFRKVSKPVASWKYGLGAIVALVHDVFITVGVYTLISHFTDFKIDSLFITALLVILGYSVNDTIVVYDRIRENLLKETEYDFEDLINKSVNQTLVRSVNTSLSTLLVLFAMYLFGSEILQGFVLALIIGIAIGTYSSIFIASPLIYMFAGKKKAS